MNVITVSTADLRQMHDQEGLVLQVCGGKMEDWVNGINELLTEDGILLNGSKFQTGYAFENDDVTCLLLPFDKVKLDIGKLAMWRLKTYGAFGGTWLSDYVPNRLGGFEGMEETMDEGMVM